MEGGTNLNTESATICTDGGKESLGPWSDPRELSTIDTLKSPSSHGGRTCLSRNSKCGGRRSFHNSRYFWGGEQSLESTDWTEGEARLAKKGFDILRTSKTAPRSICRDLN